MECLKCGGTDGFDRVVVNQVSGRELGLVCERCEEAQFGTLLADPAFHADNGCAFCDGDGKFALPLLECLIEHPDGSARVVEYDTLFDAVQFCDRHLDRFLDLERPAQEAASAEREVHSSLRA